MTGTPTTRPALLAGSAAAALLAATACADRERAMEPLPTAPLSGVISEERVTVSPKLLQTGPIAMSVFNQTDHSLTVTLEGEGVRERVGPVNPGATATLRRDLGPGSYGVRAGSARALPREIRPAMLSVVRRRSPPPGESPAP